MLVSFVISRQRSTLGTISCSERICDRTLASVEKPGLPAALAAEPELVEEDLAELRRRADRELVARQRPDLGLQRLGLTGELRRDRGQPIRVELHALALHPGEHLDQRHLHLGEHPLEPEVGDLDPLALSELPGEAGDLGRIPLRLQIGGLVAERHLRRVGVRLLLVRPQDRDPVVGGELDQVVVPSRRIDQVGGDHRVVGEVERPGGQRAEQALVEARPVLTERLGVVGDQRMGGERVAQLLGTRCVPDEQTLPVV